MLKQVGINVEYGEQIDYGENKGTFTTLGDFEYAELIKDYIEGRGGMAKIAEVHGVSSGTVHNHIKKQNKELETRGNCPFCRRVDGEYSQIRATRGRARI